jgi:cell wall-associated NlpC family hydrolase
MALSALTLAKIAATVGKTATDENGRWIILIGVLTPLVLMIMILSSPFAIFFAIFAGDNKSEPIQYIIMTLEEEFREKVEVERNDTSVDTIELIVLGSEDNTIIDNSVDVLSFFSVLKTVVNGEEVVHFNKKDKKHLKKIFWEMNSITSDVVEKKSTIVVTDSRGNTETKEITETHKIIYVNSRSAEEMAADYDFNETALEILKQVKIDSYFMMPSNSKMYLSIEEIREIKDKLPANIEIQREVLVTKALSLVDRVNYFWGGKSYGIGVDDRWGTDMEVTSSGSSSTGTIKPYGLDCSGFISWVFMNAGATLEVIGDGTSNQWNTSTLIPKSEAKEGDLVFLAVPNTVKTNHIGIIVGKNKDGILLVAHSNSRYNGVTVNTVDEIGFIYYKRPAVLIGN